MLERIVDRLSFANVTAVIALFIALGGVAWAVKRAPKNSVVTKSIRNGAVTTNKLANGAVTKGKLASSVATARAYGEITPGGLVTNAFGMTNANVTHPTTPISDGIYCIQIDSKNAQATPEFTVASGEAGVVVLSDDVLSNLSVNPTTTYGCPSSVHWVVETFVLGAFTRADAYFTILLY